MRDHGRMINSMEKGWKSGVKAHDMKGLTAWEERRGKASIYGLMGQSTKENGLTIKSVGMASIFGEMGANTMGNGKIMIWKAMVYIFGLMEEDMKDSITMIRRMDLVSTNGQTEESTKDGGIRESSMGLVFI